ncbi:MAG TPA: hypothetical protein VFN18_08770 [Solirubrobacterales bacterium]|nr:hypothetical protein [Solirubrobacterales bacterium]
MARKRRVIDLDKLRATSKVRYGRANLTVEQWVSVHATRVERALKAHRAGDANAEDVAWAFIREQVTAHTPSFDWEDADLARLLPRVIAVAKVPKLKAKSADELVPELEEIETKERERWEKMSETIRTSILPTFPKIAPAIPKDVLKAMTPAIPKLPISEAAHIQMMQTNKRIAETVKANPKIQGPGLRDPEVIKSLRLDMERISKMVRPEVPPIGIDFARLNQLTGFRPGGEWFESLKQLAEAAREAGATDAAGAAEATLNESELEPREVDPQAIYERLKELLENIAPEETFRRRAIEALIFHFMIRFIEHVLTGG